MIVLDEQLLEPGLEEGIKKWYRGSVVAVTDLRPNTIVKDDAVLQLLSQSKKYPTFITINVKDFWHKALISQRFCVICFNIPDRKMTIIPTLLKMLFQKFKTKGQRAGHVFRIDHDGNSRFYNHNNPQRTFKL